MSNLDIWQTLARTDPKHTKDFTRAGGFRGKAIKPIYTDQKMTELFGPCGAGWGVTEPKYQLVNVDGGEVVVYCWLGLWYVDPANGKRSDDIPGVGGDFAVKKMKDGRLVADDEAFKKAETDAIGNAMKHIGMSADVHMGQHDDDKYVTALRREIAEEEAQQSPTEPPKVDEWAEWSKKRAAEYEAAPTLADLDFIVSQNAVKMNEFSKAKPAWYKRLLEVIAQRRAILAQAPDERAA